MSRRLLPLVAALAFIGQVGRAQLIINLQPLSISNLLTGNAVTFSAGATSSATTSLQYQWLRNGVPIPGETNTSLTMNNVQGTNCGAFSLQVSDGQDVAVSVPADLTVNILQLLGKDLLSILGVSGTVRGSTVGVGKEAGEPQIVPGDPGGNSIWFKWTPLLGGVVTFSTEGSDFDTIMGAYTGTPPGKLVQVPSAINDDDGAGYLGSQVTFTAKALTTYVIVVDGYYGASGNVVLSWNETLSSDALPSVTKPLPAVLTVSNGAALSLPSPWGQACDWYFNGEFVGGPSAAFSITNCGEANVGAYVAEISTANGHTAVSQPLHLQMNLLEDGTTATNSYVWTKFMDSANSSFIPPTPQTPQSQESKTVKKMGGGGDTGGYVQAQTFSTAGNTEEAGQPSICGQVASHPGWYTYVAPARGQLLITTTGSAFNTELGVFVGPGTSFSTMTNIGCGYTTNYQANGQPVITVSGVPANQTNYIMVAGANGASGTAQLHISLANPVTVMTPLQSQAVSSGANVTLNLGATGGTPLTYFWELNGAAIPGATNSTLTVSNVQALAAGTYTAFVTNSVSIASSSAVLSLAAAPSITTQPAGQTVTTGSAATLNVTANGSPAPAYQWFFDGAAIGTNNHQLTIPNFQAANQGTYSVLVTNSMGAVTSSPCLLLLNGPGRFNSYSLSNGAFQLQLAGTVGSNYIIQSSPDLVHWKSLLTNTTPNGFVSFLDTNMPAVRCFYRSVIQ